MTRILSIGTANPRFAHKQDDILKFMQKDVREEAVKSKLNILFSRSHIQQRYSALPDFSDTGSLGVAANFIKPRTRASVSERMTEFSKQSVPLSLSSIEDCFNQAKELDVKDITHLITVSCTGLSAPGLELQLMKALHLRQDIERTSVNFMGCYAAIHALKLADYICRSSPSSKVLVVSTELCTLHFQQLHNDDQLLANALFADGSAAVLLSGEGSGKGLEIKGFYSEIEPSGYEEMAWNIGESGFLMTLSTKIPRIIKQSFPGFLERALSKHGTTRENIDFWALHPGGRAILDAIKTSIDLKEQDMMASLKILKTFGNMSSCSFLFVLKEIFSNQAGGDKPQQIFGTAFGPGLTIESALFEIHHA